MTCNVEQYCVHFHNRAREIFFSFFHDFEKATVTLNRRRDENVFQQLQARYTGELKRKLQQVAMEMLEQTSSGESRNLINRLLLSLIDEYINEFAQKTKSL